MILFKSNTAFIFGNPHIVKKKKSFAREMSENLGYFIVGVMKFLPKGVGGLWIMEELPGIQKDLDQRIYTSRRKSVYYEERLLFFFCSQREKGIKEKHDLSFHFLIRISCDLKHINYTFRRKIMHFFVSWPWWLD